MFPASLSLRAVLWATVFPASERPFTASYMMAHLAITVGGIAAVVLIARARGDWRAVLGLRSPSSWWHALTFVTLGSLFAAATAYYIGTVTGLPWQTGVPAPRPPPDLALATAVLAVLALVVVGPTAEELLYRGGVYAVVRPRVGALATALFSGVVFALIHRDVQALIGITLWGTVLGLTYERYGSILPCIAFHAARNAIAVALVLT